MKTSQGNRKVMVVDDDEFMIMNYKIMLIENGFDVAEAANGLEAISVYKDFQPDIVLMDINMPEMDGLAALKEIKKMDPDAKVAMVTATSQQALVIEANKSGAIDFLLKPFDQEQILGAVKKHLT
ncbi:MAG: response regulator [Chloroflexi bacterium]|nr:response regulator [Chloroflexota bacterium]